MSKFQSFKTPGVYINEIDAFPNAMTAVRTSVPAFVGYTEKALHGGKSLHCKPVRVESLAEFVELFGMGSHTTYTLNASETTSANSGIKINDKEYNLTVNTNTRFYLYQSIELFYQNGGGTCFIVSVGTYGNETVVPDFAITPFMDGVKILEKEQEPAVLLIPDAVLLDAESCYNLQRTMLEHCGIEENRFALLDIHDGYLAMNSSPNPVENFRNGITSNYFGFGAAYYPWLHTTITQNSEVNYTNLDKAGVSTLVDICYDFLEGSKLDNDKRAIIESCIAALSKLAAEPKAIEEGEQLAPDYIHQTLNATIPGYRQVMESILAEINLLPPSAAMAGIFNMVDNRDGVWRAPANVAVASVTRPAVPINHSQQEDLNVPLSGKSICAIRSFPGMGTIVWGARTLDGNSMDWRYIQVRRTTIMIEQSIKNAVQSYVFETNVPSTWQSVKAMISNFLTSLWQQGGLVGTSASEAFKVDVGLGSTMTSDDVLNGIMRVQVLVSISRPAEFIVLTYQQQMQHS